VAEAQSALAISNARPAEAEDDYYASIAAAGTRAQEGSAQLLYNAMMKSVTYQFYDKVIEAAKAEMAGILKDAKLTNIFNKHTG
jgi:hypothetical protein